MITGMEIFPSYLLALFAMLLLTSFLKIFTVLSLFAQGVGLGGISASLVNFALSFALSLMIASPLLEKSAALGKAPVDSSQAQAVEKHLDETWRPFLEKHTSAENTGRFRVMSEKLEGAALDQGASLPFSALVPAFLVSELQEAFELGLIIMLPFFLVPFHRRLDSAL
jgi:flagellar biosynthesis protein FliP